MTKAGGEGAARVPPGFQLLQERFPHVQERAARLYESDEIFRELAEDYADCAATVTRIADAPSSDGMRKEYAALFLRLETELLRYLGEHPDREES